MLIRISFWLRFRIPGPLDHQRHLGHHVRECRNIQHSLPGMTQRGIYRRYLQYQLPQRRHVAPHQFALHRRDPTSRILHHLAPRDPPQDHHFQHLPDLHAHQRHGQCQHVPDLCGHRRILPYRHACRGPHHFWFNPRDRPPSSGRRSLLTCLLLGWHDTVLARSMTQLGLCSDLAAFCCPCALCAPLAGPRILISFVLRHSALLSLHAPARPYSRTHYIHVRITPRISLPAVIFAHRQRSTRPPLSRSPQHHTPHYIHYVRSNHGV
jgi:hypothetical protein